MNLPIGDEELEAHLLELEHGFWTGDGEWYRSRMDDQGFTVFGFGPLEKIKNVEVVGEGGNWADHSIEDHRFLRIDDQAAALVYLGKGTRPDGDTYAAWMTSVYRSESGEWRLILHQQSPES